MTDEVIARIEPLVRSVFDEYGGPVTAALNAHDVEQWDSLGHVQFIVLVEQEFGIRFGMGEIAELKNIGELAALIQRKI